MVNSLWADVTSNVKWRLPSLRALAALPTTRQHIVARQIRTLQIERWGDFDIFTHCASDLSFPRLRHLDVGYKGLPGDQLSSVIRQLVGPRLTYLGFAGSGEQLLDALARLGGSESQLRELHARSLRYEVSPDCIVRALQSCVLTLLAATFEEDAGALPFPPSLLAFFATGPAHLRHLSLDGIVDRATAQAAVSAASPPAQAFASLQRLYLVVHSDAVPLLATILPRIRALSLKLVSGVGEAARCHVLMPAVARLRGLRRLQLTFWAGLSWLRSDELLELRSLTALQSLKLLAPPRMLQSDNLGDAHISEVVAAIGRNLRELLLLVEAPRLTSRALGAVGARCPVLDTLALYGGYALWELGTTSPCLFPALTSFRLDYAHQLLAWVVDKER